MDAHEEPSEWRCDFCGAGPFTYDAGPGGWDEHWRACEKNPRSKESRAMVGHPQTFPADQMNRIVEVAPLAVTSGVEADAARYRFLRGLAEGRRLEAFIALEALDYYPSASGETFDQAIDRLRTSEERPLPEDGGLDEEDVQAIALALAELSLRRPGWLEHLRGIASHYDAHLLFEQFRASSAGAVPEAPDSPLVSRVEELTREVLRLKNKCANYATYANHLEGCKDFVVSRGRCDCGLLEVMADVNVGLELPDVRPL